MIPIEYLEEKMRKQLNAMLKKFGHSLTYKEKLKLINWTIKVYGFIVFVGFFIFMVYFFSTMVFDRLGFEKTVIVLLTIILLRLKK